MEPLKLISIAIDLLDGEAAHPQYVRGLLEMICNQLDGSDDTRIYVEHILHAAQGGK